LFQRVARERPSPNRWRYGIEPAIPKRATGKPEHIPNAP
jgi:hypothetical protein